jgi:hypothetical protein
MNVGGLNGAGGPCAVRRTLPLTRQAMAPSTITVLQMFVGQHSGRDPSTDCRWPFSMSIRSPRNARCSVAAGAWLAVGSPTAARRFPLRDTARFAVSPMRGFAELVSQAMLLVPQSFFV